MYVYVTNTSFGPVFNWISSKGIGHGVHFWLFGNGQLFVRYIGRGGEPAESFMSIGVQSMAWQFVATSYDYDTGEVKIYVNGTVVTSGYLDRRELDTSRSIRVGAFPGDPRSLAARVSCIQVYDAVVDVDDIFTAVKDACKQPGNIHMPTL